MKAKSRYFTNLYSFVFIILLTFITLSLSGLYYLFNYSYQAELNQKIESAEYKLNQLNAIYINHLKAVRDNRGYRIYQNPKLVENYEEFRDRTVQLIHEYDLDDDHREDSIIFSEFVQLVDLRIQNLDSLLLKSVKEPEIVPESADYTESLINQIETTYQDLFYYWSKESLEASVEFRANKVKNDRILVLWLGMTALLSLFLIGIYRKSIKYRFSEAQALNLLTLTKRKELEFSSAFEYASIGMALVSTEGKWIRVNKSLCDLLGYQEGELLASTFQDITHPDDLEKDLGYVQQMLLGEIETYQMKKRYFTKSGDLVWVLLSVSLVWDSGQPKHFISQIQNITQSKKLQDLIQVEKQRLQQVIQGTDAGTWEWNVQTGEVIFNEKWANLIGYTLKELEPVSIETWMKFTNPEDLEESGRRLQECFEKKELQYECACRMKHKSGHWVWIMDRGKIFSWTKDGLPELMYGSHIDISGMKELEEKLSLERQKFYSIFNSTFQFIGFLDLDGTLLEANQTALEFAGLEPEDVIAKKFWDCYWWQISTETQDELKQAIEMAVKGQDVKYEVAVWDKSKNPVTILFNLKPLKDQDGRVIAVIPEGTPIQDIVDARIALITSNQELEDFASIAAHDLKEPLRMISQFLSRLNQRNEELFDEKSKRDIHFVLDGAQRMNVLIQDLLEYAQVGSEEAAFEQVNLYQTLQEVTGLMASVIEEKNAIITIAELPNVWAQPTGMKLLFQNLLGNALKYQSQNSQPEIEIASEEFENHFVISIKDNGIGISPENLSKIFNRFSRVHSNSEYAGVGMGLATCKKITNIHQGNLEVTSTLGEGSTFYFTILKNS